MCRGSVQNIGVVGWIWICGLVLLPVEVSAETPAGGAKYEHLLFQAIRRGDLAQLNNTLRGGTPVDVMAPDGSTPLLAAALFGNPEMVKSLLEHGANPRVANHAGATALLRGAWEQEKVRLLLAGGADPNARSALGNTPLMVAASSPAGSAAVELLLAAGADIRLRNKGGRTALRSAAASGDARTVRLLLDKARAAGQLEQVVRDAGSTVAIAAGAGFREIVEILLAHGADPNQSNGSRGHGLNAALLSGQSRIARDLIARGSALDRRIQPGEVPTAVLAAYTEVDDPSIAALLLEHGADFKAANSDRETALTWARLRGHRQLIDTLVAAGVPEGNLPTQPTRRSAATDVHAGNETRLIASAVSKSLHLLQVSSDTFLEVRNNCVSCHHQNLPAVAMAWARDRGFPVRQASLDRIVERQVASWWPRVVRSYELDSPYPVPPSFLGYGMWTFAELGYRPDDLTRAVSWYLAATQQPDGHWVPGMLRPPLGGDTFQATALAMRSLQLYPLPGREAEFAERAGRARGWFAANEPLTHEDGIYRMLGLSWAGAPAEQIADETRRLLARQRDDGGWAQLPGLDSDAWATGQALVALHTAGGLPTADPAYRRGSELLLKTQFEDGSWYVRTRSWPFQPYFESKFPYGRDQWISAPATAWAVMALLLAVQPADIARLNPRDEPQQSAETTSTAAAKPSPSSSAPLAPTATRTVDFAQDIKPLLLRSCVGCHGPRDAKSNFSVTTRDALLRGGDSDFPALSPGDSGDSPVVRFAAGLVENMEMPPLDARDKYPPLSRDEISLLRGWIDQGARWPAEIPLVPGQQE